MPAQTREEIIKARQSDSAHVKQRALDDTAIYNYTRRPLTDAQRAANMREGNPAITELLQPLLTFSEPPSKKTLDKRAAEILRLVRREGTPYIHIETEFFFLQHLERYFAKRDVRTKIAPDSYALSINKTATGAPSSIQPGAVVTLAKAVKRLHYLANHHCSDSGEWFTDRQDNFEALEAVEAALALYNGKGVVDE